MELREGMKFNDHGDLIELDYYNEDDDGDITWIDTMDGDWDPHYIIQELKNDNYELISYPYEVADYIVITNYQGGASVGTTVRIKSIECEDCGVEIIYQYNEYPDKDFMANANSVRPAFTYKEEIIIKKEKTMENSMLTMEEQERLLNSYSGKEINLEYIDVKSGFIISDSQARRMQSEINSTILEIKRKNKKSMFRSDIVSFK
jgi:hypothetical protein